MSAVRLFVVDDHEIVRRGLRDLIGLEEDLEIVGEAATSEHALRGVEETRPDVALVDVRLPDGDGVQLCRDIRSRHPAVACLILSAFADEQVMVQATLAGAAGYLLKLASGDELLEAIRAAAVGRSLLQPLSTEELLARIRESSPGGGWEPLAGRQSELLELVAEGLTNREIGERMGIDERTVRDRIHEMFTRLGVAVPRSGASDGEADA